jgi:hypothetical protein
VLSGYRLGLWRLLTSHRLVLCRCGVRYLHSDRNADENRNVDRHHDAIDYALSVLQLWRRVFSG